MISSIHLSEEDMVSYPLFRAIPEMVPVFLLYSLLFKALLIASMAHEVTKKNEIKNNIGESCRICNRSKSWFYSRGINFHQHKNL